MNRPNTNDAKAALETLKTYARMHIYREGAEVTDEKAIAATIARILEHNVDTLLEIAADLATEVNYHELAQAIRDEGEMLEGEDREI